MVIVRQLTILHGGLDKLLFLVASVWGCTCQAVRGFPTFAPCLEHICAGGGGGSVANMGLVLLYWRDFILCLRIMLLVGMLWADVMCDMG